MPKEMVEVIGEIKRESDAAIQIHCNDRYSWIPKSEIESQRDGDVPGSTVLVIPEWMAEERGMV